MVKQLKWHYSFEAVIYSHDKLHRCYPSSKSIIKDNESEICIKKVNEDKIEGHLKFKTDPDIASINETENAGARLFERFRYSLLLKGFILEGVKDKGLQCLNSPNQTFQVSRTWKFGRIAESEPRIMSRRDMQQINRFFNKMKPRTGLLNMAKTIKNPKAEYAYFIKFWRVFNGNYDRCREKKDHPKLISKYVETLSDDGIKYLSTRNNFLFCLLADADIVDDHENNRSEDLGNAIKHNDKVESKKDVVIKAIMCVYQLRNRIVHGDELCFPHEKRLVNFVFDLAYVDQITKYGKDKIRSFYYIED